MLAAEQLILFNPCVSVLGNPKLPERGKNERKTNAERSGCYSVELAGFRRTQMSESRIS